jgi:hypothetical protein
MTLRTPDLIQSDLTRLIMDPSAFPLEVDVNSALQVSRYPRLRQQDTSTSIRAHNTTPSSDPSQLTSAAAGASFDGIPLDVTASSQASQITSGATAYAIQGIPPAGNVGGRSAGGNGIEGTTYLLVVCVSSLKCSRRQEEQYRM